MKFKYELALLLPVCILQASNFRKKYVKIIKSPAEEAGYSISNAWDGNLESFYISPFSTDPSLTTPLDFIVDLAYNYTISDLQYTASAVTWATGRCRKYQIWISRTQDFSGPPTKTGTWSTTNTNVKVAKFSPPAYGRFMKFRFVSGTNNQAQAAEFDLTAVGDFPEPIVKPLDAGIISVVGARSYDRTLTGTQLTMNGRVFSKGIHVIATSGLCMGLMGRWVEFTAHVGIDDSCKVAGNKVMATVLVNGASAWSWEISGPTVVKPKVNLDGATTLALVVSDSDGKLAGDCINWANPSLLGESGTFPY